MAELPQGKEPIELWIDEILYGKENPFDIDCGYRLTRLMEGGCKALATKQIVAF